MCVYKVLNSLYYDYLCKNSNHMDKEINSKERARLEFVARITMPDGSVIEKSVVAEGGIPTLDDLDVRTIEGFRRSFDDYERAALKARNAIGEEITQEYYDELKKRAGRKK